MTTSQTAVFRHIVKDHMDDPPVVMPAATALEEVVQRMGQSRASAAALLDEQGRLEGILTEQDIVRRVACRQIGGRTAGEVMTSPVLTVSEDEFLYQAVGTMRRKGLRHMPVVDGGGTLTGMLFLHDALAVASGPMVVDIDRLTHEHSFAGLKEVKAAQVALAERLLADNVPAPEIQNLVSDINNDLYRRVVGLCLAHMKDEGWGEPPAAFACIVMGSGGRGESYLFPDQDNGFVIEDYPDEQHTAIDAWFIELASRMVLRLDELGFPLCNGGVMAINPVWRKTLAQWKEQTSLWMRRQSEVMLQLCDVFFDFRGAYGEKALVEELRRHVLTLTSRNRSFLRQMFGVQAEHRAALGLFGRLLKERQDKEHRGLINLKHAGTLPLAEAVRLMALAQAVPATGTLPRITALEDAGVLKRDEADRLRSAYSFITGIQMRTQIGDYRAGRRVGNFIDPKSLSARERSLLKDSFRFINSFRDRLRTELTGDIF